MEYLAAIYLSLLGLYTLIHGLAWILAILDLVFNFGMNDWAVKKQQNPPRFPR